MITGEIKNKIDQIWDTFFVAGITNPITVLEQMTYIFFMKIFLCIFQKKGIQVLFATIKRENLCVFSKRYKFKVL